MELEKAGLTLVHLHTSQMKLERPDWQFLTFLYLLDLLHYFLDLSCLVERKRKCLKNRRYPVGEEYDCFVLQIGGQ